MNVHLALPRSVNNRFLGAFMVLRFIAFVAILSFLGWRYSDRWGLTENSDAQEMAQSAGFILGIPVAMSLELLAKFRRHEKVRLSASSARQK